MDLNSLIIIPFFLHIASISFTKVIHSVLPFLTEIIFQNYWNLNDKLMLDIFSSFEPSVDCTLIS